MAGADDIFGAGLAYPLRMGPTDFVRESGLDALDSDVQMAMGIRKGELAWDTEVGHEFMKLLDDPAPQELLDAVTLVEAQMAVKIDPRIRITDATLTKREIDDGSGASAEIKIAYSAKASAAAAAPAATGLAVTVKV